MVNLYVVLFQSNFSWRAFLVAFLWHFFLFFMLLALIIGLIWKSGFNFLFRSRPLMYLMHTGAKKKNFSGNFPEICNFSKSPNFDSFCHKSAKKMRFLRSQNFRKNSYFAPVCTSLFHMMLISKPKVCEFGYANVARCAISRTKTRNKSENQFQYMTGDNMKV